MLNDDINRFLGVFSYPFSTPEFIYKDPLKDYYLEYNRKCSSPSENPLVKDKKNLRIGLINYINRLYKVYSYDEIYLYLDKWYLYPQKPKAKESTKRNDKQVFNVIFHNLKLLCQSFISQRDGKFVYKYWENEYDKKILGGFSGENKIYLFHSLNRLIPMDILVIIFMLENNKSIKELQNYYGYIEVSDMLLDTILHKGVAENHLHSGVSCSFISLWGEITKPLNEKNIKLQIKNKTFFNSVSNRNQDINYLCFASTLKVIITLFLAAAEDNQEEIVKDKIKKYKKMLYTKPQVDNDKAIDHIIYEYEIIQEDFFKFANIKLQTYKEFFCDTEYIKTSYENIFLYKALKYIGSKEAENKRNNSENINSSEETDTLNMIKELFLNYLRIKNYFYQLVVQQKTIHGLDFFQKFYHDNSNFGIFENSYADYWKKKIKEQLQNNNLKKLELRTSVWDKETDTRNVINGFMQAYYDILRENYCCRNRTTGEYEQVRPFPRVGLVFHLLKQEQESYPEKCTNMYEIYSNDKFVQYGEIYNRYSNHIQQLTDILQDSPMLSRYILGIDVASLENAVPTWVYVDAFDKARDASIEHISMGEQCVQSLCFTFHAGEDFRHILSGIRRIYEVVNFLKFHAGDRIGHGIALGISPELWYRNNSTILIPRIEALENYVWAYYMLSSSVSNEHHINLRYIENRIYELAEEIYVIYDENENINSELMSYITPQLLVNVYKKLFIRNFMPECFNISARCNECDTNSGKCYIYNLLNKDSDNRHNDLVKYLINAFHCKFFVHNMNEPINTKVTEQDIIIASELQKMTADLVNRKGIIVEVNPSSNITISDTDTLSASHLFNINSDDFNFNSTIVCINSDDPSVFNTNVSNEIGYIYFSMLEKGNSREKILSWIDKIRENGMNASFIRDDMSDTQMFAELKKYLDECGIRTD